MSYRCIQIPFLALLLLSLVACSQFAGGMPQQEPLIPFRLCTSAVAGAQLPAWYAYEKGLFKEYGLQVEMLALENGSTAASALLAGEADACQIAGSPVVNAALAGEDLLMIAGLYNRHVYQLMVTPDIQSADDLRGKKLGISRLGGATEFAVRSALQHFGLQPDRDVTIIEMGATAHYLPAMSQGQIAGAPMASPQTVEARELGFHSLLDLSQLPAEYQHVGIAARRSAIEKNRQAYMNLIKALSVAISRMKHDPEGVKAVLAKYLSLDPQADAASLEDAYQELVVRGLPARPYPTLPGLQALIDAAAAQNPAAIGLQAASLTDLSLLGELDQTGFFEQIEP